VIWICINPKLHKLPAPSPLRKKGWDEGDKYVDFILLTPTLSSRRGSLWLLQPFVSKPVRIYNLVALPIPP